MPLGGLLLLSGRPEVQILYGTPKAASHPALRLFFAFSTAEIWLPQTGKP